MALLASIERLPRPLLTAAALALAVAVGWLDYLTGHEYSVSILYLAPVFVAAWFVGWRAGVAVAFACGAAWLVAELLSRRLADVPLAFYWNDAMELSFFLVVGWTLSSLKGALEKERRSASTDLVTGLANRRAFYRAAAAEIARLERYGHPFSVAYVDVDDFKAVNDTFGHSAGDELLRLTGEVMSGGTRRTDTVARLGGDEFALLFPETTEEAALAALRKIQDALGAEVGRRGWPVSLSVGLITFHAPPASVDEMLDRVDALMYEVKRGGKGAIRSRVAGAGAGNVDEDEASDPRLVR